MNEEQKAKLIHKLNIHCIYQEEKTDGSINKLVNEFIEQTKQEEREKNINDIKGCILNSEDYEDLINNLHLVFKT